MFGWVRRRRPLEDYSKLWLGAIALGIVGVLVAAVFGIGALDLGKKQYRAEFAQAATLNPGDIVTIAGVSVGTVKRLELAGDRVVATFDIDKDIVLGGDTKAAIKLTTLLGSRYLAVSPEGDGTLHDATIGLANTTVPYDLQKTLADATTTFQQVDADRVAHSMSTLARGLGGVPAALPGALADLQSLTGIVAARRDQLSSLLDGTDKLAALVRDQQATLGSLVLQGRDLLAEITSRREAVQRLFASATAFIDTLKRILNDAPGVNATLASLREFTTMITDHDALLRNILQTLPIPVRNIANATGSGPSIDVSATLPLVDSWMCAISGRAKQFNLVEYFQDCQ